MAVMKVSTRNKAEHEILQLSLLKLKNNTLIHLQLPRDDKSTDTQREKYDCDLLTIASGGKANLLEARKLQRPQDDFSIELIVISVPFLSEIMGPCMRLFKEKI